MIQLGTILKVTDRTGIVLVQCIKVLGPAKTKIAYLGQVILVSVKWINTKKFKALKERKRKKFAKGTIHRALIIRTKVNFRRTEGVFIRFDTNDVVIVNKNIVPVSNRVYGLLLKNYVCVYLLWVVFVGLLFKFLWLIYLLVLKLFIDIFFCIN